MFAVKSAKHMLFFKLYTKVNDTHLGLHWALFLYLLHFRFHYP